MYLIDDVAIIKLSLYEVESGRYSLQGNESQNKRNRFQNIFIYIPNLLLRKL